MKMNNGHMFEEDEGPISMGDLAIDEMILEIFLNDQRILVKSIDDAIEDEDRDEDIYNIILDFEEVELKVFDQLSYLLYIKDAGGRTYTFNNTLFVDIEDQ